MSKPECKFIYGGLVLIKKGFYKGCTGRVEDCNFSSAASDYKYQVQIKGLRGCGSWEYVWQWESNLEARDE